MPAKAKRKEHPLLFKEEMVRAILAGNKTQTRRVVTSKNSLLDGAPIGRKGAAREIWDGLDWSLAWRTANPLSGSDLRQCFLVPCRTKGTKHRVSPRWQKDDLLWVRESFVVEFCYSEGVLPCKFDDYRIRYKAGKGDFVRNLYFYAGELIGGGFSSADYEMVVRLGDPERCHPSIHMPRWACRLELDLLAVQPQLGIQDISEADATAEGVQRGIDDSAWLNYCLGHRDPLVRATSADDLPMTARESFRTLWDSINAPRGLGWAENPPVWALTFVLKASKGA